MIGASVMWPWFSRRTAPLPPVRTARGTVVDIAGGPTCTIAPVTVQVGDTLLLAVFNTDPVGDSRVIACDLNGAALTNDYNHSHDFRWLTLWHLPVTVAVVGGTITMDWSGSAANPSAKVALAVSVAGLPLRTGDNLKQFTTDYAITANPDSLTDGASSTPVQILWGIIATAGRALDVLGAWQHGYTAGQRAATALPNLDLKEGYLLISATATGRAHIIGQTARISTAVTFGYM